MLADLALDQRSKSRSSLPIGFVDLEKAFENMPRAKLLQALLDQYSIDSRTVECISQMNQDTAYYIPGASRPFQMKMGLK